MTNVIMVCSGAGGVGKSITATYLAACLVAEGKRVFLLDTDAGFGGMYFTIHSEDTCLYDLEDVLEDRCQPMEATVLSDEGYIYMPPPDNSDYYPTLMQIKAFMDGIMGLYDYIIIDCAQGFSVWQEKLCDYTTAAIIVTEPTDYAARLGGKESLKLLKHGIKNQWLIINRVPQEIRGQRTIMDLDDVMDIVGVRLLGYVPYENPPVARGFVESNVKKAFARITKRLIGEKVELKY